MPKWLSHFFLCKTRKFIKSVQIGVTHLDQGSLFHSPPTLELWLRHSVFWNKISQIDALTVILPNLRCITETLWEANPTYDQFSSSTFIAGQPSMRKSSHEFDGEHCLSQNSSLSSELHSLLLSHWEGKWQIVFYHTAASWVSKDHYLAASTQPSQTDCFQMSYFLHAVSLLQKNISLSVTLRKRGSQSRRLNRMAMEFRKTLLSTTAAPSHCSQAHRRPHSHLLHKMMGKQTFFILYRYDFDLKNPYATYIFSLNPPKQFPKVIWNIYFTKSLLYASQRTSCRSQFSPFTMRIPRIELR